MSDDDLVRFRDVVVLRSTAAALLCRIRGRRIWLLRSQISGKLWHTGDRGRFFVGRSVVVNRKLGEAPSGAGR